MGSRDGGLPTALGDVADLPGWVERLFDGFGIAVVLCDLGGVVRHISSAALGLLPGLVVGRGVPGAREGGFEVVVGVSVVIGRFRELGDGWGAWVLRDVGDERAREVAVRRAGVRADFLARASRQLGLSLNPARTVRAVVELATELGRAATVVLVDGTYAHGERGGSTRIGRWERELLPGVLVDALEGAASGVERHHAGHLGGSGWNPLVDLGGVGEAVTARLSGSELAGPVLVVWVAADDVAPVGDPDGTVLGEFADRAGVALAAARVHAQQVATAAALRESLLPGALPDVAGVDFGAQYRPATGIGALGGDFYEVSPDGRAFVFGDVVGEGARAAVVGGRVRQVLGALRLVGLPPRRALRVVNESLVESGDGRGGVVTAVVGVIEPRGDGGVRVELTGGGHLAPLVLRADGSVRVVDVGGMAVGEVARAVFRSETVELAAGESCVFYSDGITGARGGVGGEEYGVERVRSLLAHCHVMPAPAVAERVALGAQQWISGAGHGDIAVLVVRADPRRTGA
ncbi:PP2C family protein-serine/threonine phosphatase [Actinosynnema mirum]|uniref:Protein serine/threonine phosphatase n=1 Tax=Actinosynnema mirum (strain ATCC 29888 / DSM 43827 / JCM 3225 / NBRC 14064 / NCIMB 13271 / NRRL B-12336 / IMRU 3971 / 101) TaxID=446462 RepID=C6WNK5_ACTMD|nr:PP2C family protein-serine/threonine phosphatase [Actinosynnema mirum]ACU34924.1 protein serine/threonine phosphatase [Actinosynnema mirum DSM 43827]